MFKRLKKMLTRRGKTPGSLNLMLPKCGVLKIKKGQDLQLSAAYTIKEQLNQCYISTWTWG